ncbi:MAG: patatin-like phospholipase family protein [Clostridia bacterium]|nr:patatin-like phospholipase family protein [Clostridia bacterium]
MEITGTPLGVLKEHLSSTKERFEKRMNGLNRRSVGIALGSGAARGLAHIGVLDVLWRAQIPIDIIVGTSIGSVIGGCYASGMEAYDLERVALLVNRREVLRYTDFVVPRKGGLIAGTRIEELLRSLTGGKSFSEMRFPFACACTDILTGDEVVMENGPVYRAMRASSSIPGVFQPVLHEGRVLVDGGILNPIPVNYLTALNVDVTIAVDVMPTLRAQPDREGKPPSIVTTIINAFDIMGKLVAAPLSQLATVMLKPAVGQVQAEEFWLAPELIAEGRRVAEEALPKIRAAVLDTASKDRIS